MRQTDDTPGFPGFMHGTVAPLVRGRSTVQSRAAAPSQDYVYPDNSLACAFEDEVAVEYRNAPIRRPGGAKRVQPLSVLLNDCAAHMADKCWPYGYHVYDYAPKTWAELQLYYAGCKRIAVWPGASDDTVFSSPVRNWDFRAWHDWCHLTGNHDFSADGEAATCKMQQAHVQQLGEFWLWSAWEIEFACNILDAEVNGQRMYKDLHGVDVVRQRDFDMAYICNKAKALSEQWL